MDESSGKVRLRLFSQEWTSPAPDCFELSSSQVFPPFLFLFLYITRGISDLCLLQQHFVYCDLLCRGFWDHGDTPKKFKWMFKEKKKRLSVLAGNHKGHEPLAGGCVIFLIRCTFLSSVLVGWKKTANKETMQPTASYCAGCLEAAFFFILYFSYTSNLEHPDVRSRSFTRSYAAVILIFSSHPFYLLLQAYSLSCDS